MENSNAYVSLALLQVVWDKWHHDYFDILKPFFLTAIKDVELNGEMDLPTIKQYISTEFGITLYDSILLVIIKRLSKEGVIKRIKSIYYRTDKPLDIGNFSSKRQELAQEQDKLFQSFQQFYNYDSQRSISLDEARDIILEYLSRYADSRIVIKEIVEFKKKDEYQVGKFVEHVYNNNRILFGYIENVIRGCWVANAIYLTNATRDFNMKFSGMTIYIDTSLLIYALGYAAKEQTNSCKEMLNVAQKMGIKLKCFQYNVSEIEGILDRSARTIRGKDFSRSKRMEYFIRESKTESDILLLKSSVSKDLKSLEIEVEYSPGYLNENAIISHSGLHEYLMTNMNDTYHADSCKQDVEAIAAIYRLRNGLNADRIEKCCALFVTSNFSLVNNVSSYMKDVEQRKDYPPIISDINLTNILWLRSPDTYPNLLKQRIISDAYAAVQPSNDFWDKVSKQLEKLVEKENISYADSLEFRTAAHFQETIIEQTCADTDLIDRLSIEDIIKLQKQEEHDEILNERDEAKAELIMVEKGNAQRIEEIVEKNQNEIGLIKSQLEESTKAMKKQWDQQSKAYVGKK